jgi:CRISPR-associated exonuclease Cas4
MSASERTTAEALIESISNKSFRDWYHEYQYAQNFREGKPWRNSASCQKPPNQHNPSQLKQCHRKIYYQRLNAPEERAEPHGVFWLGTRIEEDIILKWLW